MCDIFKNELLMLLNDKVDDNTLINISNEIDIMLADYDINRSQSKTINLDEAQMRIKELLLNVRSKRIKWLWGGVISLPHIYNIRIRGV